MESVAIRLGLPSTVTGLPTQPITSNSNNTPMVPMAATTGYWVRVDINRPVAAKLALSRNAASRMAARCPRSRLPLPSSDRGMRVSMRIITSRKATTPRYLPSTISVIDRGALNNRLRLRLRRSSLIRRMVSSGTITSHRTMVIQPPNTGTTTTSVSPGGLSIRFSREAIWVNPLRLLMNR